MKSKLTSLSSFLLVLSLSLALTGCSVSNTSDSTVPGTEDTFTAEIATDLAVTVPVPGEVQDGSDGEKVSEASSTEEAAASTEDSAETAATSEAAGGAASSDPANLPETTEALTEEAHSGQAADPSGSSSASKYDPETQKLVALTFDDGPDTGNTKATTRIVDTMEKYGAHCTFFAVGQAIKEWFPTSCVDVMKKAIDIGCEYATHSYSHANLNKLDEEGINSELDRSISAIENITGQKVTLLRPPYGNAADSVKAVVDMPMIQWDVDTLDWKTKDPASTLKSIQENVKPGSIVLMHDIYRQTADAVEDIVPWLQNNGYTLVTVTELFEAYGIPLEGHKEYYCYDTIK